MPLARSSAVMLYATAVAAAVTSSNMCELLCSVCIYIAIIESAVVYTIAASIQWLIAHSCNLILVRSSAARMKRTSFDV